jgi:hypothetical protein
VSRSAWLPLITVNWSILFAQTAPDPVVKVIRAGGHTRLILRNMHNVPIQAYAIDYSSGHGPLRSQSLMFNPLGTNPIAPNATMDIYLLDVPAHMRFAVVYADGAIAGNKTVVRKLLAMRARIRRSTQPWKPILRGPSLKPASVHITGWQGASL